MLLDVASLFEMHPPFMHVYLVARLCTLGSGGTTRIQTDPHPLALKPVSVSETLLCLKSICLTNFLTLEALPALVLKVPGRYYAVESDWLNKIALFLLSPES